MNSYQLTKLVLVLSCIGSDVLAGLLPGGGGGGAGAYQYNRPGGFGDGSGGGGFGGDTGFGVGGYRGRPTQAYGPPGSGSDTFSRPSGGFGGQQSHRYPQFGDASSGGYQGAGGYERGGYGGGGGGGYGGKPRPYSFQYEVVDPPSGNDYSQHESSDGNVVQGEYRVLLPDSRTQIVRYTADDVNGYNADVQYEGQAQYSRASSAGGYPGSGFSGGYQGGRGGGYSGHGGGFGGSGGFGGHGGGFGGPGASFGGDGASNQYLPSRYRK